MFGWRRSDISWHSCTYLAAMSLTPIFPTSNRISLSFSRGANRPRITAILHSQCQPHPPNGTWQTSPTPFFGKVGTVSSMNLQNKNSGLCNHANAPPFLHANITLGSLAGQPFHQRSETKHWAKQWRGLIAYSRDRDSSDWRPLPTDECHVGARSRHFLWLFNVWWCKTREKKAK